MSSSRNQVVTAIIGAFCIASLSAQSSSGPPQGQQPQSTAPAAAQIDDVRTLVGRLDLEKYKATIKGLTAFGDRREGTERNRKAVDWIEAQLKSYGCETGRVTYDPAAPVPTASAAQGRGGQGRGGGQGQGRGAGRAATPPRPTPAGTPEDPVRRGAGGKGYGGPTGVNNDPTRQPDEALRALNSQPIIPGPVDQVYCTKWGTTRP